MNNELYDYIRRIAGAFNATQEQVLDWPFSKVLLAGGIVEKFNSKPSVSEFLKNIKKQPETDEPEPYPFIGQTIQAMALTQECDTLWCPGFITGIYTSGPEKVDAIVFVPQRGGKVTAEVLTLERHRPDGTLRTLGAKVNTWIPIKQ